jgi:NAD(P)-dependent dehydrogenase (short-subunit alcohol dehydrogenase family)
MKKVLVVFGYGPGISNAVAHRFGAEGFSVALVSRNPERLAAGVADLSARGIEAAGFTADAADQEAVRRVIGEVRSRLGPITVIEWTAYAAVAPDLTTAGPDEQRALFDVAIVGLTTALQAALPDLKQSRDAALLVTNGGLGLFDPASDQAGVDWNVMGLSVANAAKHKLVRLLSRKLKPDGVYVGEVVVTSTVKGTAFDRGNATTDPAAVAEAFWKLYTARERRSVTIG